MNVKGYKLLKQLNSLTSDNYKTQTINDQHAVVTLGNRASYEHALSSVKRILKHFLWDLFIAFFTSHRSPLSERLEQASGTFNADLGPKKKIGCMINK